LASKEKKEKKEEETDLSIAIATEPKPDDDDQIRKDENTPLEIITLALVDDPAHQEHGQDDGDHIPLRENHQKDMIDQIPRRPESGAVERGEQHETRRLEENHLQGVGAPDLHGQCHVAVHGKGDGVEEFRRVGD
jgi:hypothetical protein